jgi:hypothetical protein
MTHSFDITTALVAERQHTLREEAHHHRLGRIARRSRRRSAARRAAGAPAASPDVVAAPLPAPVPTAEANPQERTAA